MADYPLDYDVMNQDDATGGGGHYHLSRVVKRAYVARVIPWQEGDELPEDVIRRMRDE